MPGLTIAFRCVVVILGKSNPELVLTISSAAEALGEAVPCSLQGFYKMETIKRKTDPSNLYLDSVQISKDTFLYSDNYFRAEKLRRMKICIFLMQMSIAKKILVSKWFFPQESIPLFPFFLWFCFSD